MKRLIIIFISLICAISVSNAEPPKNFSKAKKIVRKLFSNDRRTLYCDCKYDKYNRVNLKSCNMETALHKRRAQKTEIEHMMPASNFGRHYKCWREKLCRKKNGKTYRGRKCCEKIDEKFKKTESELYNLWPSNGLVNGARSNYKFSSISGTKKFYGCDFKIEKRRVEPASIAKGIVSRANLFMSDRYGIKLSKSQFRLFTLWNKSYPPTQREIQWSINVAKIEGYKNLYINNT